MEYINILNYGDADIYNCTLYMYNIFGTNEFPNQLTILDGFQDLIYMLYKKHNINQPLINTITIPMVNILNNDKDILVGFSGGLDSAYCAFKLRDKGYNVILFHITNLNKAYPKEDIHAKNFAINNHFEYIEVVAEHLAKEYFIDNPLKDQLILASMIEYGIKNNIKLYTIGAGNATHIEDATIGMTVTDSIETNQYYWKGVQKYIPNIELKLMPNDITKYDKLKYILERYPQCLNDLYSCISPHRFNKQLHDYNNNKYNIQLLDDRCGSCYKCCMEAILLSELGYYDNKDFVQHCWDILAKSKNSHRKDLFNKKIPLDIRYKNIMSYG